MNNILIGLGLGIGYSLSQITQKTNVLNGGTNKKTRNDVYFSRCRGLAICNKQDDEKEYCLKTKQTTKDLLLTCINEELGEKNNSKQHEGFVNKQLKSHNFAQWNVLKKKRENKKCFKTYHDCINFHNEPQKKNLNIKKGQEKNDDYAKYTLLERRRQRKKITPYGQGQLSAHRDSKGIREGTAGARLKAMGN